MSRTLANPILLDLVPDPNTDPRLLPGSFIEGDNSRRIRHYKIALRKAMRHLTPTQRNHILLYYETGLRKCEIAKRCHISNSAVTQSIRAGERILKSYIELYMCVFDDLEQEFLADGAAI